MYIGGRAARAKATKDGTIYQKVMTLLGRKKTGEKTFILIHLNFKTFK